MFNFKTDEEALSYVNNRLGRAISLSTYSRYQRRIESGEFTREWFADYAIKGYALERIKLLSSAYLIRSRVLEMMQEQKEADDWKRDRRLEVQLFGEFRETCKMIAELNASVPVIAEIDTQFENYEKRIKELEQQVYRSENKEILARVEHANDNKPPSI